MVHLNSSVLYIRMSELIHHHAVVHQYTMYVSSLLTSVDFLLLPTHFQDQNITRHLVGETQAAQHGKIGRKNIISIGLHDTIL